MEKRNLILFTYRGAVFSGFAELNSEFYVIFLDDDRVIISNKPSMPRYRTVKMSMNEQREVTDKEDVKLLKMCIKNGEWTYFGPLDSFYLMEQ